MHIEEWQKLAAKKRQSILDRIPKKWLLTEAQIEEAKQQRDLTGSYIEKFLDPVQVKITKLDGALLHEALAEGRLTATEVTIAFCRAAAVAHQINPCLLEIFFDEALERARELDDYYADQRKPRGALHGVPISIKDQFHVKGVDTTMGYVGYIGRNLGVEHPERTHKVESQLTAELRSLGAVLYCKTSVPQTLMIGETKNNIIGETLNPINTELSCGGSSGGEGALMALGGSILGFGTDIGGSVRMPAAFCGIFSLKPTPERLSYRDVANTNPGQNTYRSAVGLMGTSLSAIQLGLKSVLSTQPWRRDPAVVPLPFQEDVLAYHLSRAREDGTAVGGPDKKPLKLGIFWSDGVAPHPPVMRGLEMVSEAVVNAGHKIMTWDPPAHSRATDIHMAFLTADGCQDVFHQIELSGEPLLPELAHELKKGKPMELLEYQDLTLQGLDYECQYSDYWNASGGNDGQIVDAIIMPVAPHAGVISGQFYHAGYTEAISILNYSSCVIPVTRADQSVDRPMESYKPKGDVDELNWKAYNPEVYHGGPVGVQIVTRKFEEEKALAIAQIVQAALAKQATISVRPSASARLWASLMH